MAPVLHVVAVETNVAPAVWPAMSEAVHAAADATVVEQVEPRQQTPVPPAAQGLGVHVALLSAVKVPPAVVQSAPVGVVALGTNWHVPLVRQQRPMVTVQGSTLPV